MILKEQHNSINYWQPTLHRRWNITYVHICGWCCLIMWHCASLLLYMLMKWYQ